MRESTHAAVPDPRNEDLLVYINGRMVPRSEASVSVFDSGFLVGDGVWEGIRYEKGTFLFLDRHLERLEQGARAIGLRLPLSRSGLKSALEETVRTNGMEADVHLRLMVTRGVKRTPSQDPRLVLGDPTLVIIAEYKRPLPEAGTRGLRLFTSTVRRGSPDYLDPRLNCHSKLHEVVALIQALEAGADEALMLDIHGFVSTCNSTNFFIVRRGEVWTSTGQYCMNGITRGVVLELCRDRRIGAFERNFSLTDVYDADEAFVTGTFGGVAAVSEIDGRQIGEICPGPLTQHLQTCYREKIEELSSGGRAGDERE